MPLRHVRRFRLRSSFYKFHFGSKQVSLTTSITTQKEKDLWQSLQQEVESCSPFKPHTLGRLLKTDDKGQHFIDIPRDGSEKADEILQAAKTYILIHCESLKRAWTSSCTGAKVFKRSVGDMDFEITLLGTHRAQLRHQSSPQELCQPRD